MYQQDTQVTDKLLQAGCTEYPEAF